MASQAPTPAPLAPLAELDELTLARAQRGDDAACRALVVRYQRPVFALLSRMVGTRPAATALVEDLAQETFLRVFRALAGFDRRGPARLSTWLLTIATRLAIDELRRRAPATEPLEAAAALPAASRADELAQRGSLARAIERATLALPPEQRAVFLLREAHGLDYDEIARALEVDLGTVKSRLSRAKSALREALVEDAHA